MNELEIREATIADDEVLAGVYRNAYRENRQLGFLAKVESVTESDVSDLIWSKRVCVAEKSADIAGGVLLETTDEDRVKPSRFAVHER
jgi:hypothetical protein